MNRRTFLFGAGAAGASLATGTGAFTTFRADRTIAVETVGDAEMLVGLTPGELNPQYVRETETGQLVVDLNRIGGNTTTRIEGLLTIANNTEFPSDVFATIGFDEETFPQDIFSFPQDVFVGTGEETRNIRGEENALTLESGESVQFGFTLDVDVIDGIFEPGREFHGKLMIHVKHRG